MAYFKIGDTDFSAYVNGLKVNKNAVYNSQTNASGDTLVDYINSKRTLLPTVGVKSLGFAPHNLCLAMLKYKF